MYKSMFRTVIADSRVLFQCTSILYVIRRYTVKRYCENLQHKRCMTRTTHKHTHTDREIILCWRAYTQKVFNQQCDIVFKHITSNKSW